MRYVILVLMPVEDCVQWQAMFAMEDASDCFRRLSWYRRGFPHRKTMAVDTVTGKVIAPVL